MPVQARQHIRKMRGGSCAHLMYCSDGGYYVVKFQNNPQHSRVLINELICSVLLDYLGLPSPGWEIVEVTAELIEAADELEMEFGRRRMRCEAGLHFGSRFPVDPLRTAVYDYVPASMLRGLINVEAFRGMTAFDKWVSNANGRQAIFFRDRASRWLTPRAKGSGDAPSVPPRSLAYVANMIDHGFAFNARRWDFSDLPEQGIYTRREVYEGVRGFESFEPWLDRIVNLPTEVLDDAYKRIPGEWHDGEWDRIEAMLEELYARRERTPDLVQKARLAARDPFPEWTATTASGGRR